MPTIEVNRAPVMTLWAAVVAEHLGFEGGEKKREEPRARPAGEPFFVALMGRSVPVINTPDGIRATAKGSAVQPASVERYLESKFGPALSEVRQAMEDLAAGLSRDELEENAYDLYVRFRPEIPAGKQGWGAKGELDTGRIRQAADER